MRIIDRSGNSVRIINSTPTNVNWIEILSEKDLVKAPKDLVSGGYKYSLVTDDNAEADIVAEIILDKGESRSHTMLDGGRYLDVIGLDGEAFKQFSACGNVGTITAKSDKDFINVLKKYNPKGIKNYEEFVDWYYKQQNSRQSNARKLNGLSYPIKLNPFTVSIGSNKYLIENAEVEDTPYGDYVSTDVEVNDFTIEFNGDAPGPRMGQSDQYIIDALIRGEISEIHYANEDAWHAGGPKDVIYRKSNSSTISRKEIYDRYMKQGIKPTIDEEIYIEDLSEFEGKDKEIVEKVTSGGFIYTFGYNPYNNELDKAIDKVGDSKIINKIYDEGKYGVHVYTMEYKGKQYRYVSWIGDSQVYAKSKEDILALL